MEHTQHMFGILLMEHTRFDVLQHNNQQLFFELGHILCII